MRHGIIADAPTSSATTGQTEPGVVAAILSAEGSSNRPLSSRSRRRAVGIAGSVLVLASAIAFGYGAARRLRSRA